MAGNFRHFHTVNNVACIEGDAVGERLGMQRETEREKREREKGGRHLEEDQTGQMSDGKMTREMGGWGLEGRERKVL